ncbi:MAG: hypothetical protein K2X27_04320 [Candidatus Obscuribacterales bacterium]|nr:hypothetical protein [Candidatus Obscuribacterales bacterium]
MQLTQESARKKIVFWIYVFYVLMIIEGALRKWVLPEAAMVSFFVRDPVVFYIYFLAIQNKLWPARKGLFAAATWIFAAYIVVIALQMLFLQVNPLVYLYGLRIYFLLIPLAFIMKDCLKGEDVKVIILITMLLAIPMAGLVYEQFHQPKTHWINKTLNEDLTHTAMMTADIVRPSGTFSDGRLFVYFIASAFALTLPQWLLENSQRVLKLPLLAICSASIVCCLAYNGNRTSWIMVGVCIVFAAASIFIVRSRAARINALIGFLAIFLLSGALGCYVFSSGIAAMLERQEMAVKYEGDTLKRVISMASAEGLENIPWYGRGIGLGSGGGKKIAGYSGWLLAEREIERNAQEAGVFSLLFIGFRIALTFFIFSEAIKATRRSNNPTPLVIFGFCLPLLTIGLITIVGTIQAYGWFFAGLNMAANNFGKAKALPEEAKMRPQTA